MAFLVTGGGSRILARGGKLVTPEIANIAKRSCVSEEPFVTEVWEL